MLMSRVKTVSYTHLDVYKRQEQLHGHLPQLLVPVSALLGAADHDHLLLLELVDAVEAALLDACL